MAEPICGIKVGSIHLSKLKMHKSLYVHNVHVQTGN